MRVYPGLGDGSFGATIDIAANTNGQGDFTTGDCDADGDLDILFYAPVNASGPWSLTWWRYESGSFVAGAPLLISGEALSGFAGLDKTQ